VAVALLDPESCHAEFISVSFSPFLPRAPLAESNTRDSLTAIATSFLLAMTEEGRASLSADDFLSGRAEIEQDTFAAERV
jgi:hypothetical protein